MSGIEIRCGRRISRLDLIRGSGSVDWIAKAADEMIVSVAEHAIERIRKEAQKFTLQREGRLFRGDEIVVEIAATIIPTGELAYLESREREYERERQRVRDLTAKVDRLEARRQKMRRRGM